MLICHVLICHVLICYQVLSTESLTEKERLRAESMEKDTVSTSDANSEIEVGNMEYIMLRHTYSLCN